MPERVADRPGRDEANAFHFGVILLMGVAGKDDIDTVFLEQVDVFPPLSQGEIEVVLRLVQGFPDNGTMQKNEGVPAFPRGGKFLFQPGPLLCLGLFHAVLYAVRVNADECAAALPEGEAVVSSLSDVGRLLFTGEFPDVMVSRYSVNRGRHLGDTDPIDGILHGVLRIVDQVAGHEDIGGIQGIGGIHGRLHQGIGMDIRRRLVHETDLRVAHLHEGERGEAIAGERK